MLVKVIQTDRIQKKQALCFESLRRVFRSLACLCYFVHASSPSARHDNGEQTNKDEDQHEAHLHCFLTLVSFQAIVHRAYATLRTFKVGQANV